jgi:probable rRNA maturation factor
MSSDDISLLFRTSRKIRRRELRQFLEELTRTVTRGRSMACVIAGDAELQRLNKRFRGKNSATDVLSFPSADGNGFAGDMAISADRARAQAAEHRHSIDDELRILMLHGALHLAGMDHETDSGKMARAEARWRKRLGLPSGLIERTDR